MTVVARPEILSSLGSVRDDVQRRVAGLDRYRALKAIEQTIADFPALGDITQSLTSIRDRVQQQLDETREYRALRTIERIMPELSEVLALLDESAGAAGSEADAPVRDVSADIGGALPVGDVDEHASSITVDIAPEEQSIDADVLPQVAVAPTEPQLQPESRLVAADEADPGEAKPPANDAASPEDVTIPAPPRPSYGIAQFLNTQEPPDDGPAEFRTASPQEGRAA